MTSTATRFGFLVLFFLSGFAALIYQVVWQRILTFFGGADIYAVTIIVSAFMGGLGFGSLAGGYLADRLTPRGRLVGFALCELAVAVFAVFSAAIYYDFLYVRLGSWDASRPALAAVIFAVTLWPTFFMGMSLPLLARLLATDPGQPDRWVAFLYGANTLGAALGSGFAAAVLFRNLDFVASLRIGAALNLICAGAAAAASQWWTRDEPGSVEREVPDAAIRADTGISFRGWVGIYALAGFVALSLEIVWFRVLGVILKSNSFTFGHLLAVYLFGVGAGALLANHPRVRSASAVSSFFMLQAAIPVVAAGALTVFLGSVDRVAWAAPLWQYLGEYEALSREKLFGSLGGAGGEPAQPGLVFTLYVAAPVFLMTLPTLMMGLSFGCLQRAVQEDVAALGRRVGWLQTANIIGSTAGALLTGLGLLTWLGTAGTLRLLVCCSAVFLVIYSLAMRERRARGFALAAAVAVCLMTLALPSSSTLWARLHRSQPRFVIHAEDSSGLSVLKHSVGGRQTIVYANGLGQSTLPYGGIHTVLGALPAMVHPRPALVAVIGLGSGDTTFAIGGRPETVTVDSIEIIAPQLETLRILDRGLEYSGLHSLLEDRRVRHWFGDGRAFIRKSGRRYDIIEADALRPMSAFAGNLFSVEYFELLRDALAPGGIAVTWTPTPRVADSFVKVFSHVLLFHDLAMGSMQPIAFDRTVVESRMGHPFTRDYYQEGGISIRDTLDAYVATAPRVIGPEFDRQGLTDLNRDLFPKDEFAIPYTGGE